MSKTRAKTQPMPILNASLPAQFRQFRLALAREPGHPEGDAEVAYIIVAPLDSEDRIDAGLWREHREACRVVRQRPGVLIVAHRLGLVLANAGIDASNVGPEGEERVLLLPVDPDRTCREIRRALHERR